MNKQMPTIEDIQNDLNKRYLNNPEEYLERVEVLKGVGYRILRNSKGQHRVEYNNSYFSEMFGGVFGGLFNE